MSKKNRALSGKKKAISRALSRADRVLAKRRLSDAQLAMHRDQFEIKYDRSQLK